MIEALEKEFDGTWYMFLRLHPKLAAKMEKLKIRHVRNRLIDVSQRPNMNEIIAGADGFLIDYSSAIFKAAIAGQPDFLYVDDLEEYVEGRGDLKFDMYKLPFSVAIVS